MVPIPDESKYPDTWYWHKNEGAGLQSHIWRVVNGGTHSRSACSRFSAQRNFNGKRDNPCGECLVLSKRLTIGN